MAKVLIYDDCKRCMTTGVSSNLGNDGSYVPEDPCTGCGGAGYRVIGGFDDTKLTDILNKCNDILEKCNDILDAVSP